MRAQLAGHTWGTGRSPRGGAAAPAGGHSHCAQGAMPCPALLERACARVCLAQARRRKDEVEKLNEQLRVINVSLRQQARSGTVYAPGE